MLIKGTNQQGQAIPLTPREALKPAVGRACKALNTLEKVYCVDNRTIEETSFKSMSDKDGNWEAWAEGTADIGYVNTATGNFHSPVPHTFKLYYKLTKDDWGIPDIEMAATPEIVPIERNPSKLAGPIPVAEAPQMQVEATERGAARAKVESQKRRENTEQKQ